MAEHLVATLGSVLRARPALEGGVQRVRPTDVMARLRELDTLGWVEPLDGHWKLTVEGRAIVEARPLINEAGFALALCVRHEERNQRVVTRLLRRMLTLNAGADGLVVLQRPRVADALVPSGNEVPRMRALIHDWWRFHVEAMPGMTPRSFPAEPLSKVEALCGSRLASTAPFVLQKRVEEVLADSLNEALFGDLVGPRDLATWQRCMDRAGLALRTRRLPDRPGGGWFPTGAFAQGIQPGLVPVAGLNDGSETWSIRELPSPEAELPFARALNAAYTSLRVRLFCDGARRALSPQISSLLSTRGARLNAWYFARRLGFGPRRRDDGWHRRWRRRAAVAVAPSPQSTTGVTAPSCGRSADVRAIRSRCTCPSLQDSLLELDRRPAARTSDSRSTMRCDRTKVRSLQL